MNTFKFPIAQETLNNVEQLQGQSLRRLISGLRDDQCASIIVLSVLSNIAQREFKTNEQLYAFINSLMDGLLSDFFDNSAKKIKDTLPRAKALKSEMYIPFLEPLNIELLDQDSILSDKHLVSGFKWKEQQTFDPSTPITDSLSFITNSDKNSYLLQDKVISTFVIDDQEPKLLQGYSGVGKTTVASLIMQGLKNKRKANPIFIVQNRLQEADFQRKHPKGYRALNVNSAVYHELNAGALFGNRNGSKKGSESKAASILSISAIGQYNANQVYRWASIAVYNYCLSNDPVIGLNHLPFYVKANQQDFLLAAHNIWEQIIGGGKHFSLPIEWYHRLKLLSLKRTGFQNLSATHLIFDECHDYSPALLQILNDTKIPVISMLDDMQNLSNKKRGSINGTRTELYESIRQGEELTPLLSNLTIQSDYNFNHGFLGSNQKSTSITKYDYNQYPNQPCLILAQTITGLIQVIGDFEKINKPIYLFSQTKSNLSNFLDSAVHLNNGMAHLMQHKAFSNVFNWDDFFARHKIKQQSKWDKFLSDSERVNNLITKVNMLPDYNFEHNVYSLALTEHSKSLEFQKVFLNKDVFDIGRDSIQLEKNKLYISMSRALNQLYIPSEALEYVDELSNMHEKE